MDAAAKICLVGPPGSGKTAVARLLADWDTTAGAAQYLPTQALRIQEIERSLGRKRFSIQLWDCSGDKRFQNCWPALQNGAQGLILVRNVAEPSEEQDKQLEKWYKIFAVPNRLKASQCAIVNVHQSSGAGGASRLTTGTGRGLLANVNQVSVSLVEPDCQQQLFLALDGILGGA